MDGISLLLAVGTVIVPRIIMSTPTVKEDNKDEGKNIVNDGQPKKRVEPKSTDIPKINSRSEIQSCIL
jgi:hypothetical protein